MEKQTNDIVSQVKLYSIAGIMFFAPFIKKNLESGLYFSEREKNFILGYIKIGYLNLSILAIVLVSIIIDYLFFSSPIFSRISTIGCIIVYIILLLTLFACVNDINMWEPNESIKQHIPHKDFLLKSFVPIENFILWYKQENYDMPYRRLKESIFLRNIFIFFTIFFGNTIGLRIFSIIIVRLLLLFLNIDIIPLSIKKLINGSFFCNPGEIIAYISAPIIAKIKKIEYKTIIENEKMKYAQGQSFDISIVIQYILFILILFLLYQRTQFSPYHIVLAIAIIMWTVRILMFYKYKKKVLRIPILSEIVGLIFNH